MRASLPCSTRSWVRTWPSFPPRRAVRRTRWKRRWRWRPWGRWSFWIRPGWTIRTPRWAPSGWSAACGPCAGWTWPCWCWMPPAGRPWTPTPPPGWPLRASPLPWWSTAAGRRTPVMPHGVLTALPRRSPCSGPRPGKAGDWKASGRRWPVWLRPGP